ncbi:MAG: hypothetical protein II811_01765 [Spirochaetaceae bacterium]|nr:hypothetical protein [Spirochaetaceae bacterium]
MEKFIYRINKLNDNGFIWIYQNDGKTKREEDDFFLNFFNEAELLEGLAKHKKGAVFVVDENDEMIAEGKRLSEKLGLQFVFPRD